MLSTTVVHRCRHFGSERLRKNGHANNGVQRAKCVDCGRTFYLEPEGHVTAKSPRAGSGSLPKPPEYPRHHAHLWSLLPDRDGLGGGKVAALPAFEDTLRPSQNGDVLELDELWSFMEKKTQECWLWLALLPTHPPNCRLHGGKSQLGRGTQPKYNLKIKQATPA